MIRLGWCGILMQAEASPYTSPWLGQGNVTFVPSLNQSNTTHDITQQISSKLLKMDVLTFETC